MARHRHLGHAFGGHDPGVCAYTVRANALQLSGDREQAKDSLAQGLALAEKLDHPNSLAHALHNCGIALNLRAIVMPPLRPPSRRSAGGKIWAVAVAREQLAARGLGDRGRLRRRRRCATD